MTVFVCQRRLPVHQDRRDEVTALIEATGQEAVQVGDGALEAGQADVVLVLGSANWFPRLLGHLSETPRRERPFVALWHTEPLPLPLRAGFPRPRRHARELAKVWLRDPRANDPATNYRRLAELSRHRLPDLLVVGHPAARAYLRERGMAAEWEPPGYHPSYGRDLGLERDIDVLFLGTMQVPRRRRLIRRLRRAGVAVEVAGSWRDPRYWEEERTRRLNRARILLHLARRPGEMAYARFMLGLANGALVLAEPIYDSAPYVAGEHYVSAAVEDMPATIAWLLAHEPERARITAAGRRLVTTEVTMKRSVDRILTMIGQQRADGG